MPSPEFENCLKTWGAELQVQAHDRDANCEPRQIQVLEGPTGGLTETYFCAEEGCRYQAFVTGILIGAGSEEGFQGVESEVSVCIRQTQTTPQS